jgi:hypothetical protein
VSAAVANSPVFWAALIAGLAFLYVLPIVIGLIRHIDGIAFVVILNCFPIAWPAALVAACVMPRKEDH